MIVNNDQSLAEDRSLILLDNGSLKAETTLRLRELAVKLGERVGEFIHPVSARHSNNLSAEELGGVPADSWGGFLERRLGEGARNFVVLPLFFGPSGALVEYVPRVFKKATDEIGKANLSIAASLVDLARPDEDGVAQILLDLLIRKLDTLGEQEVQKVLLIDHGSPLPAVAACRDLVGKQLSALLEKQRIQVVVCSMERRPGDEYSFGDPLLEDVLGCLDTETKRPVILSRMFLFPGRHAGEGGDIDQIVSQSTWAQNGGKVHQAELVGTSDALVDLLATRFIEWQRKNA